MHPEQQVVVVHEPLPLLAPREGRIQERKELHLQGGDLVLEDSDQCIACLLQGPAQGKDRVFRHCSALLRGLFYGSGRELCQARGRGQHHAPHGQVALHVLQISWDLCDLVGALVDGVHIAHEPLHLASCRRPCRGKGVKGLPVCSQQRRKRIRIESTRTCGDDLRGQASLASQAHEPFRTHLPAAAKGDELGYGRCGDAHAVEIIRNTGDHVSLVGYQLGLEGAARLESQLLEHALAEAVDGGYGGLVEPCQGVVQGVKGLCPVSHLLQEPGYEKIV